jgi:hypothetical protein
MGAMIEFSDNCMVNRNGKEVMRFYLNNAKLYELEDQSTNDDHRIEIAENVTIESMHERLGHLSISGMKKLQDCGSIPNIGIKGDEKLDCIACDKGKATRSPFGIKKEVESKEVGELTHSDVCGPIKPTSLAGNKYYVAYTDDYSRHSKIYFMRKKSEQIEKYKEYRAFMKTQLGVQLKKIRTDSGGEYTSNEFEEYLRKKGTEHESKPPRTPQLRGVQQQNPIR